MTLLPKGPSNDIASTNQRWGQAAAYEATEYEVEDTMTGCGGTARFRLYQHAGPVVGVSVWVDPGTKGGIDAIALAGIPIDASK